MNKESLKQILDLLQYVTASCADLDHRISVAEEIFQGHSCALYEDYQKRLDARNSGVIQTNIAVQFEQLREQLLQS